MDFSDLNEAIPYVIEGKLHSVRTLIAKTDDWLVQARSPGKYAEKTNGGDYVIIVHEPKAGWKWHKFTHVDLFNDIQEKVKWNTNFMQEQFAPALANVVYGKESPRAQGFFYDFRNVPGISVQPLLYASQALALAEHRRYAKYEAAGGGRFLPARYALGIIFGKWSALDAANFALQGSVGIKILESKYGKPPILKDLIKDPLSV